MMDIMTYFVLPVLGSVFMLGAIFYSMNQIGTNREIRSSQQTLSFLSSRAVVVCVYILLTIVVSFLGSGVLNLIVMFLIPLIGHYYYNSERQYIIFYVLFVVVIYLVDALSAFGLTYLFSSGVLYFANEHLTIIGVIFTIRFVEFSILRILTGIIRRMKHGVISKKQMLSYFILPAFSIVNLFSLMYLMDIFVTEDRFALLIINIGLLICINLYFTSVFDTISRNNRLKNELNLHHQQQEIQVRYYEALEQKYDTSRSLVHDIRNHIQSMQQLYEMEKQP
ncbi:MULTISPECIES: hypothetical protein [unclassified Fusibacter]|uniref:hypothetical protein n=1 Tax=unclassified Fusibacter TaxID=2624464 RepID=UPI0010134E31|nr:MULTISPECIES: hypothetical protein [unclassified Fusibacter]MCK8058153.1 hypothetical protein [Fusibacter sp. A2]NPE20735.1 hypothetical protein [Fusibacter sp. A1]RXV62941.1 hypothetical protein DWB64_02805 [Fusibacter sp. A1]